MRSNRGISEFASFPLLMIIALVFLIISLFMLVAEFRNQTSEVDAGLQAAAVGLLHAERDQVEVYLRTALDRSVRDGIARAYAYRSAACPLSEHGLPILSDSCGYEETAFRSASEKFATERFSNVTSAHPTAVLNNQSVTIAERARGEVSDALVFLETGANSKLQGVVSNPDPSELPLFVGPLESFDKVPDSIEAEPTFDIDDETLAYCPDDIMSEEKAATFVKNTIEQCKRRSGTCSCGSVPLPSKERPEVREDGVYLYDYALGIEGADLEEAPGWRFWTDTSPVERFYVHRNDSGVILNATDPGLATCSQSTGRVALVPVSKEFPLIAGSAQVPFDVLSVDEDASVVSSYDLVVFLAPNLTSDPRGTISYYGDETFTTLHNVALRADPSVYGSPETFEGPRDEFEEPITSCDELFLVSTERTSVHLGSDDPGVGGTLAKYEIDQNETKVLYVRYPTQTAAACGSEPMTPGTDAYERLMEGIIEASQRAIEASSTPPRTRIACIDDPIKEWVELDGSQQYLDVYPTVAVPIASDFVWPLERVDDFEGCWGPKEHGGTVTGYHKGIDIQPPGTRVDRNSPLDRFTDYAVVSAFEGVITAAQTCRWTVYDTPAGTVEGDLDQEQLALLAGEDCRETGGAASFGEHLVIETLDGRFRAIYAHLAPGSVRETLGLPESAPISTIINTEVRVGQRLGFVGNTGYSTGAHLHFEIFDMSSDRADAYPQRPQGGYAAPARRFAQFNPLCVLPKTVPDAGQEQDIWTMFGTGASPETEPVSADETPVDGVFGFFVPSSEAENCNYNYWMAYNNYNPLSETYGVCPAGGSVQPSDDPPVGTPLPISVDFAATNEEENTASFLLIVNAASFERFTPSVSARLDSGSGAETVQATVRGEVHPDNRAAFIEIPLESDTDPGPYVVTFEIGLGDLYAPVTESVEFEP